MLGLIIPVALSCGSSWFLSGLWGACWPTWWISVILCHHCEGVGPKFIEISHPKSVICLALLPYSLQQQQATGTHHKDVAIGYYEMVWLVVWTFTKFSMQVQRLHAHLETLKQCDKHNIKLSCGLPVESALYIMCINKMCTFWDKHEVHFSVWFKFCFKSVWMSFSLLSHVAKILCWWWKH